MDESFAKKTDDSYELEIPLYDGRMLLDLRAFLPGAGVNRVRKVLQMINRDTCGDTRELYDRLENACGRLLGGELEEELVRAQARVDEKKVELLEARGRISALKLSKRKADEDGRLFLDIRIKQAEHDAEQVKDALGVAMMDLKALSKGRAQVQKALEVIRVWRQK